MAEKSIVERFDWDRNTVQVELPKSGKIETDEDYELEEDKENTEEN